MPVLMLVTAIVFWFFTYSEPSHKVGKHVTLREQLAAFKDPKVWRYSQYYSIVFGGYVALALWMTKYYVSEYGFRSQDRRAAGAAFSIPGGVLRAVGGYFSDSSAPTPSPGGCCGFRWSACSSCPTRRATSPSRPSTPADLPLRPQRAAVHRDHVHSRHRVRHRKASSSSTFSDDYPGNIRRVSGVVGLAGGLGGFLMRSCSARWSTHRHPLLPPSCSCSWVWVSLIVDVLDAKCVRWMRPGNAPGCGQRT